MKSFTWNADQEISGKRKTTRFSVGWRNYLDSGLWLPINTEINSDRTVVAFPGNVQFPASSQGWSSIVCDHKFSIRAKIDSGQGNNPEPEFRMDMQVLCQHNVTGTVNAENPSQMNYIGAWDTADLLLGVRLGRAARIEKIIRINSMPSGDGDIEYEFKLRSSHARVFAGENLNKRPWGGKGGSHASLKGMPAYISRDASPVRGVLLNKPVCWWFENGEKVIRDVAVRFVVESDQETVTVTKRIPREFASQAFAAGSALYTDATFSPDASPETSSVDGYTGNSNVYGSWAVLMAASATLTLDSGSTLPQTIRDGGADVYRDFNRPITLFDTSSIGVDQVVTAATQEMTVSSVSAGTSWDGINLNVYGISPASNTAIVTADHLTISRTPALSAGDAWGALRTTGSGAVASFAFNASGLAAVNTTGISKFALAWEYEESDTTPAIDMVGATGPAWHSSEASGTANDPSLIVTHSQVASETQSKTMLKRILK